MTAQLARDHWHPRTSPAGWSILRRHVHANLEAVVRWYRDPELARLSRYQTQPMDDDEVERFFRTRLLSPDAFAYAIHERATDRLIGLATFSNLDPDNGCALFHITIGERDVWGRAWVQRRPH